MELPFRFLERELKDVKGLGFKFWSPHLEGNSAPSRNLESWHDMHFAFGIEVRTVGSG